MNDHATIRWSNTGDGVFLPANSFTAGLAFSLFHRDRMKTVMKDLFKLTEAEAVEFFEMYKAKDPRIAKYKQIDERSVAEFTQIALETSYTQEQVAKLAEIIERQTIFSIGH